MDASLSLTIHQWASSNGGLASIVVLIAQTGIFALPAAVLVVWLVADGPSDRPRQAVLVGIVAACVAFGVGLVLERVLNRPRPFVEFGFEPLLPHSADSSFPSDHTLVGVALVGPLVWGARSAGIGLFVWALIVGCARVAAGIHYPSDIVGSAILAVAIDAVVFATTASVRTRLTLRRWGVTWAGSRPGTRRR